MAKTMQTSYSLTKEDEKSLYVQSWDLLTIKEFELYSFIFQLDFDWFKHSTQV